MEPANFELAGTMTATAETEVLNRDACRSQNDEHSRCAAQLKKPRRIAPAGLF
jgi:hypothetical protein